MKGEKICYELRFDSIDITSTEYAEQIQKGAYEFEYLAYSISLD